MAAYVRARVRKCAIPASVGMNDGEPVIAPFGSVSPGLLHGLRGLHGSDFIAGAGPGGEPYGTSDFLSHHTGGRAFHFLPGGRAKRRADPPLAARVSFVIADVRAAFCPAFRPLSPSRARLSGIRA